MQCNDLSTAPVCFRALDAGGKPSFRTLTAHYEYRDNGAGSTVMHAVRYTDADGTPVDTSAGEVSPGACLFIREEVCVADDVEGVPAGLWTTITSGQQASNQIPNDGLPQEIIATFVPTTGAGNLVSSINGNIGAFVNSATNPDRLTEPSANIVFSTSGPDFPVLLRSAGFAAGAVGTTGGLFGTPATNAVRFSTAPISVPAGVVEIAPGVYGSPGGALVPADPFIFPAGALSSSNQFTMELFRSQTTLGAMNFHLLGTDPDAVVNRRPAFREVTLDGETVLRDYATNEILEDVIVVPCTEDRTPYYSVAPLVMCDAGTTFLRHMHYEDGELMSHTDTLQDGTEYTVSDEDFVTIGDCCSSLSLERKTLCDLNPAGPVGAGNEICVTKFVRETTLDCMGNIISQRDLELDGITPYTPVEVVDCDFCPRTTRQQEWVVTGRTVRPGSDNRLWDFTLQSPFDPAVTGNVAVEVIATGAQASGCAPAEGVFRPNNRYVITPDATILAADILRVHLDDLDVGERVGNIDPPPSSIDGNAMWVGSQLRGIVNDRTGYMVYDGVPSVVEYQFMTGACLAINFSVWSSVTYSCCEDEDCGCPDAQPVVLCDDGVPFLRNYLFKGGNPIGYRDTTLDGETPYGVSDEANVGVCGGGAQEEPRDLVRTYRHATGVAADTTVWVTDNSKSVSVTWFTDGFLEAGSNPRIAVPAGFSWNVESDGVVAENITVGGGNYIITTTRRA